MWGWRYQSARYWAADDEAEEDLDDVAETAAVADQELEAAENEGLRPIASLLGEKLVAQIQDSSFVTFEKSAIREKIGAFVKDRVDTNQLMKAKLKAILTGLTKSEISNEIIFGGDGDNIIYGGLGPDTIFGGDGNDTLHGGLGTDTIFGGDGNDIINGNLSADVIFGDDDNDAINSGWGNDTVYGGSGDDVVLGGVGADILQGGAGNDTIYGGIGIGSSVLTDDSSVIEKID